MNPNAIRANFPKYMYLLALAAFFAFATGNVSAQNVYETDDGKKFEVRLVPSAKEIFLNERIGLTVEIRNLSDVPLVFMGPGGSTLGGQLSPDFRLTVVQPDGIVLPRANGIFFSSVIPLEGNSMANREETIVPGGVHVEKVRMANSGYFLVTGAHRFSIEYKLFIGTSAPKSRKPAPTTAETVIEAVSPDPQKVGRLVARLGEAMLKGDEQAAERLTGIHDPRRVPYFIRCVESLAKKYATQQRRDRDNSLFERVVSALLQAPSRETDQTLEKLLAHSLEPVRETTARLFADWRHPDKEPIIFKFARDPNPVIRGIALGSFARVFNPKTRAAIIELANDPDENVRSQATHFLETSISPPARREYQIHDGKGIFTLKPEQPFFQVGQPAALLLEMKVSKEERPLFFPPSSGPLRVNIRVTDPTGQTVMEAPGLPVFEPPSAESDGKGPRLAKFFIPTLPEKCLPGSYFVAIDASIAFKTPSTTEWAPATVWARLGVEVEYAAKNDLEQQRLISDAGEKTMGEETPETIEAFHCLAAFRDRRAIPHLVRIAERYAAEFPEWKWDGSVEIQRKYARFHLAVRSLAEFDDPQTRAALQKLLQDPNFSIRGTAGYALLMSPHPTMRNLLFPLWRDPSQNMRVIVANSLRDCTSPEAEAVLWKLFADEDEGVRRTAMYGLEALRRKKLGY